MTIYGCWEALMKRALSLGIPGKSFKLNNNNKKKGGDKLGVSKVLYLNDDELLKVTDAFREWQKTQPDGKGELNEFIKACFLDGLEGFIALYSKEE